MSTYTTGAHTLHPPGSTAAVGTDPGIDLSACLRGGDIRLLLHPSERSRYHLAMAVLTSVLGSFAILVFAAGGVVALGTGAVVIVMLSISTWVGIQVFRARLLGNAVRVTEQSLPELERLVRDIRGVLSYDRPIDVYVVEHGGSPATLTSYLGQRVIVLEGGLVAELLKSERRPELTFLIARFVGALKARHMRFSPALVVLQGIEQLQFLNLFLMPYERATAYSGDQIGLACCGDLRPSLGVLNRLLVGKELTPQLAVRGVLDQAAEVRRRRLPRLAQLFSGWPHLTNRYLNLLAFASVTNSRGLAEFRGAIGDDPDRHFAAALKPWKRPARGGRRILSPLAACVVTALVLAVVASQAHTPSTSSGAASVAGVTPTPPVTPPAGTGSSTDVVSPAVAYVQAVDKLLLQSHQDVQTAGAAVQQASTDPGGSVQMLEQVIVHREQELAIVSQSTPPAVAQDAHVLLARALRLSLESDRLYLHWVQVSASGSPSEATVTLAAAQANDAAATGAKRAFLTAYNQVLQHIGAAPLPAASVF